MSVICKIWDCDNLISCPCFGMCGLHTAANATWQCEHMNGYCVKCKTPEPTPEPEPEPEPQPEPQPEPTPQPEPEPIELPQPMISILRPAYGLPDVVEDEQSPSPARTPEPEPATEVINGLLNSQVEDLAKVHTEHMAQIMAEMEAMRAKLKAYEEQKAIIENIQQLEAKCAKLEVQQPVKQGIIKNGLPPKPNTARTLSRGPPVKIALSNSSVGPKTAQIQAKKK